MSENELSDKSVDELLEETRYDNAIALSDNTFYDMMNDAQARQAKDGDIDLPLVVLRTMTSSLYTLGKLGWTKEELYQEVDDYFNMAAKKKEKKGPSND